MTPWTASSLLRRADCAGALTLLPALLSLLYGSACVMPGTHKAVVAERDTLAVRTRDLERRVALLEASNESLSDERVELIDEIEDLRLAKEALDAERAELEAQVLELTERRDRLEEELTARDALVQTEQREVERLRGTYDELVSELQAEVAAGRIEVEQVREGIRVRLAQEILFPSGSAMISPEGRAVLARVAPRLGDVHSRVEVHGHTDARPIHGRLARIYPSNWELAGARAAAVVRLLVREGIDPERLRAVSFGSHRPVAPNDTPEGRSRNRRIEIRLIPVPPDDGPTPTT